MQTRGVIHFKDRARQLNDFSGLRWGNITPTDADGIAEFYNQGYIGFEGKYKDKDFFAPENLGQRLAIERLTDNLTKAGKKTIFLIYKHDVEDCSQSVDVSKANVIAYRFQYRWEPAIAIVKPFCDAFLQDFNLRRLT